MSALSRSLSRTMISRYCARFSGVGARSLASISPNIRMLSLIHI